MRESTVTKSLPRGGFAGAGSIATIGLEMAIQERVMPLMTVTEAAAAKIRQLMSEETDVSVLRVAIQGGGCSGFQYGLGFDRGAVEGDLEFEMHGVQVVVDPFSAPYLQGAEIDYVDSIQAAGFAINDPNAVSSCGCGHSFQVEDGDTDASVGGCGSGCSSLSEAPRSRRRFRARRLLRRWGAARRRARVRGGHDRAAADALGPRPSRRRARPPQAQERVARVRANRGEARLPVLRERRGRARCLARRPRSDLRRGDLRLRRPVGQAARHPRRGAP